MFLKLDGVTGEAKDKVHGKEIDVLSWSWGMTNEGSAQSGGGAGSGKVNVQDVSVTKFIDSSSPQLMLACCKGTHFANALITVRKAGEKPLEYLKITLTDLIVTSVTTGGSGGEDRLTENVSLNFAKFKVEYTPQKKDGSGDAPVTVGWDIAGNVKTG